MRRSREDAAGTRRQIVGAAGRLFRGRGIQTVSVSDIMASIGLTVGGFYRHFASKTALVAESIDAASMEMTGGPTEELPVLLGAYLSEIHVKHPEHGCPVAALCSEVRLEGRATKNAFTVAIERLVSKVSAALGRGAADGRQGALEVVAMMVGAVMLARASSDDALAAEILGAARKGLRQRQMPRGVTIRRQRG